MALHSLKVCILLRRKNQWNQAENVSSEWKHAGPSSPKKTAVKNTWKVSFLSKKRRQNFQKSFWGHKPQKGKAKPSLKIRYSSPEHSKVLGFSEALSESVSPRFPWSKSTACFAWRRFYICVNYSSIHWKGKDPQR